MKGTVIRFDADRGWGFIKPEDGGRDLFVHYSDIDGTGYRSLTAGEQVEFAVRDTPKGPAAAQVRRITG